MNLRVPCALALAFLCVFGACSPHSEKGNRLVIGVGGSLNLGTNNPVYIQRNANVWETFSRLDDSYKPQPLLAESWSSGENGTVWTMRLRRDVVFHNGDSLDASLAIANIRRFKDHPEFDYYGVYTYLDSIYTQDNYTIILAFSRPCVDLPNKIGHYFSGIFSPESFDGEGKISAPIGCGPYEFVKSETGKCDMVKSFDRYFGGKPYFDTVEFRIIPDPLVRVMALIRGDIDMIAHHGGVLPEHLKLLRGNSTVVVDSCDIGVSHYLLFNCASEAFRDRENRVAFSLLLNRKEMVDLILRGKGIPAHDYFVGSISTWDRARFPEIPDTSMIASASAMFRNKPITLVLAQGDVSNWGYKQIAEYLADYYGKRGIDISIVSLEGGAWQRAIQKGDYSFTLYPLSIPTGTPELFIRALACSQGLKARNTGNRTHFSSADVDSLVEKAVTAPSLALRDSLYNRVLDIMAREQPVVPLYHERYYYAYKKGLKHISLDPFLKLDLSRISR
ncbi:ABC transporter substrate-binding protein [bacterium]|nr:ABC transporter substrate-binding protein [bacterium]